MGTFWESEEIVAGFHCLTALAWFFSFRFGLRREECSMNEDPHKSIVQVCVRVCMTVST